ncbi:hypothetical protein Dimus_004962, partial [Dionaea muscipula]
MVSTMEAGQLVRQGLGLEFDMDPGDGGDSGLAAAGRRCARRLVVDGHVVVVVLGGWSTMADEDGCIVDGCLLMVAWVIEG